MTKRLGALFALVLLPSLAFGAGFAKQTIFLSQESVTEGDTVRVYAVISNDATSTFAGTLVFKDGEAPIGSVAVSLTANEAETGSVSWKPQAGAHTVNVELQTKAGDIAEKESASFSIKAKPKPVVKTATSSQAAAAVESSSGIQEQIGNVSPAAQKTVAPVFTVLDSARSSAADVLDTQLANTKASLAKQPSPADVKVGEVKGEQTIKTPDAMGSAWYVLYTIYFYILTVLRFVVGSAGVFYPLLAVLFLFFMWKMFRRFKRA